MKHFALLLALGLSACAASAQAYIPFPDSNALWMVGAGLYNAYTNHPVATCDMPLTFGTDTVIAGRTYHRLYAQEVCNWLDTPLSPPPPGTVVSGTDRYPYELRYTFRQDVAGKKVYLYVPNEHKDTLLYDFANLAVGQPYPETILSPLYLGYMVQGESTMILDGVSYRRWSIGTSTYPNSVSVVEGIGSSQGFATGFLPSYQHQPFESMYYLHCFIKDGVTLFSNWPSHFRYLPFPSAGYCGAELSLSDLNLSSDGFTLYPNPASEKLSVRSGQAIDALLITDIQGRSVKRQNVGGMTETVLDVSTLEAGHYTVTLLFPGGQRSVGKFIKVN